MHDCARCIHRRGIISENGFHYVCGLSWQAARNCILGKKQHYVEIPNVDKCEDCTQRDDPVGCPMWINQGLCYRGMGGN